MGTQKTGTYNAPSGAVRSDDGEYFDFTSMPVLGLLMVARTADEGRRKYSRFNYTKGFGAWKLLNRAMRHIFLFLTNGNIVDLAHATWGLLATMQELLLNPEQVKRDFLAPGMTMTGEMINEMEATKASYAAFRETEEAKKLDRWNPFEMQEIQEILKHRTLTQGEVVGVRPYMDAVVTIDVQRDVFARFKRYFPDSVITRITSDQDDPNPEAGESWAEYGNGQRFYYKRKSDARSFKSKPGSGDTMND